MNPFKIKEAVFYNIVYQRDVMPSALHSYWVALKDFSLSREFDMELQCHCDKLFVSAVLLLVSFERRINQSELDHCTFPSSITIQNGLIW